MANDFARHDVPLGDPRAVARQLHGLLAAERDLGWLYFGNEAGGIVSVGRLADGTTVFLMTDGFRAGIMREFEALPSGEIGRLRKSAAAFDTRQKSWYTRAKETRKPYWTELYTGAAEPILGVSLATPVFDKDGSFVGVYGTDLILTQLANLMRTLHVGDDGRTFLVDAAGRLIASSGGVLPVSVGADGRQVQLNAAETADPVVRSTARHLNRHPEIVKQTSADPQSISFDDAGLGAIYAAVDRLQAPGGIDWIIVSALPGRELPSPCAARGLFLAGDRCLDRGCRLPPGTVVDRSSPEAADRAHQGVASDRSRRMARRTRDAAERRNRRARECVQRDGRPSQEDIGRPSGSRSHTRRSSAHRASRLLGP